MSAAPAVKAARVPPSTFSTLLRRSKFSSYDPKIGQIYATYDGSAARGDWGLKRPLAIRRRDARLAIHNVDTIYQQTEWTSAYTDTEWIRKFDELGTVPRVTDGEWARRFPSDPQWLHSSESDSKDRTRSNENYLDKFAPSPNTATMSAKRFERYLRKIRRQRQDFQSFLEIKEGAIPEQRVTSLGPLPSQVKEPYYKLAQNESRDAYVRLFLAREFAEKSRLEDSTIIQPIPHPTGGLVYTNASDFQNRYRSKPVPGRALHLLPKRDTTGMLPVNVAVAGWVGRVRSFKKDLDFTFTDFGTKEGDPRRNGADGEGVYRPMEAELRSPPEVVGRYPQRLDKSELSLQFVNWKGSEEVQRNPHTPGSREYVAHLNIYRKDFRKGGESTPAPVYRQPTMLTPAKDKSAGPSELLSRLQTTIGRKPPSDEDLDSF